MRTIHLSRLRIPGGDLDDLARLHAEWALGLDRFAFLRAERIAAGVPEDALPADLVDSQGGHWAFKFALPEQPEVSRTSVIKISTLPGEVLVEHLVMRDGRADKIVAPTATPPDVVLWLLDRMQAEPASLRSHASRLIDEPEVPSFVDEILSPTRTVPIIIVAVENASRSTLVDPDDLARRLAGMATVVHLASVRVSYRLRDELVTRDMPDKFGCYNGGVRILRPGIQSRDNPYDHLLLLPVRLLGILAKSRNEQVAGIFCELIAEGEDPRRWLRELEPASKPSQDPPARQRPEPVRPRPRLIDAPRPDAEPLTAKLGAIRGLSGLGVVEGKPSEAPRLEVAENLGAYPVEPVTRIEPSLTIASDASEPTREPDEHPTLEEVEEEVEVAPASKLERASATASPRARTPRAAPTIASTWSALADDVTAALQLAAEQEQQFDALQSELAETRRQLRRAQQERDELSGPPSSVADAVARAEATYPDKLIVLRSARASAEDSPFRDPGRVLFVLMLLANCDASSFGEVLAKAVGSTARWKPRDSPETVAKFGKDRTFTDSNRKPKLFTRHVTIGHGVNSKKCLQLYYDVLGDGRIELAWCGEHRPTVSEDT
ncbi:hypothetical protein ACNOYE_17080 [Nannocystaceae bacterium ST9]